MMCGIIGSFSKGKINELGKLNKSRGNKVFSLSSIKEGSMDIKRELREFDVVEEISGYSVLHIQSPTKISSLTENDTHPVNINSSTYLWHNGMLLDSSIKFLQKELNEDREWDTFLLLKWLVKNNFDFNCLNNLEGSFACLLMKESDLYCFRNKISPLFIDNYLNISSTKFDGSKSITFNTIYRFDFSSLELEEISKFNCEYNPYNF
jgi:glutamine phosphoribosylpyrophosphate amidotransferase